MSEESTNTISQHDAYTYMRRITYASPKVIIMNALQSRSCSKNIMRLRFQQLKNYMIREAMHRCNELDPEHTQVNAPWWVRYDIGYTIKRRIKKRNYFKHVYHLLHSLWYELHMDQVTAVTNYCTKNNIDSEKFKEIIGTYEETELDRYNIDELSQYLLANKFAGRLIKYNTCIEVTVDADHRKQRGRSNEI